MKNMIFLGSSMKKIAHNIIMDGGMIDGEYSNERYECPLSCGGDIFLRWRRFGTLIRQNVTESRLKISKNQKCAISQNSDVTEPNGDYI